METNPSPPPPSRPRLTVLRWSNALLLFTTNLPAADGESSPPPPPPEWWHVFAWPFAAVAVAVVFVTAWLVQRWRTPNSALARRSDGDLRFSREHITETFISALPTLTRELNLEVATSRQTETFERTESKSLLWGWLDLGTNVASLRVPVTYRYHLRLSDSWKLDVQGSPTFYTRGISGFGQAKSPYFSGALRKRSSLHWPAGASSFRAALSRGGGCSGNASLSCCRSRRTPVSGCV